MGLAPDEFAEPTSRVAAIRLRTAKAMPGVIFATFMLLYADWGATVQGVFYAALGGLLFQLLLLLIVGAAYHFVCWVAGVDSGELGSNPLESRRLLAGMVAIALMWAWTGIQHRSKLKELTTCVEERVRYESQEPIRYIIEGCRESDATDDDWSNEF